MKVGTHLFSLAVVGLNHHFVFDQPYFGSQNLLFLLK